MAENGARPVSVVDSQGALDERLERCAIELWAVDNRARGMGESCWDALGWGDRRDYRWMAAAVLREAGVEVPSEDAISAAAQPGASTVTPMAETCWRCLGTGACCDECGEPGCDEARPCRECGATGQVPRGTSMRENGEPPPADPTSEEERRDG